MYARRALSITFALLGLASQAHAQPFLGVVGDTPALRFEAGPRAIDRQHCGASVAISDDGTRAIVGVPDYTIGPVPMGSPLGGGRFRIFLRTGTTWAEEFPFTSGTNQEELGTSVAMSGDGSVVVVGAPGDSAFTGRARVYRRTGTTWAADGFLVPTGLVSNDRAGMSVAITQDGTYAFVGVPYDDTARGTDAGQVAVFVHGAGGWTQETTIIPTTGNSASLFGASLAVASARPLVLVIGAPGDVQPSGAQGAAYTYVRNTATSWSSFGRLVDPAGTASDGLGWSVAIDSGATRVAVGAPGAPVTGPSGDGKVLHFEYIGAWTLIDTLTAPSMGGEQFGSSLAMSSDGTRLLVGAPHFSTATATTGIGRLYLLSARSGGHFIADTSFSPSDAADTDQVAQSVALSRDGSRAVLGVPYDDVTATDEGTARVFAVTGLNGAPCASGTSCGSGFCTDSVCCNSACVRGGATPCQACIRARTGVANGTCAPVNDGAMCAGATGTCDPADFCDGVSAACPATFASAGTVCRASTGTCDPAESCTGTSGACPSDARAPDGSACHDGDVCNGAETCVAGSCTAGTALACDDANVCTADACDAITGCANVPITGCCNVDADCDDANMCNGTETCVAHACMTGVALGCDDGDACTTDACDPAVGCTSTDIAGCCRTDPDCNDSNPCTTDVCLGTPGTCQHTTTCDAGLAVDDAAVTTDAGLPATDGGRPDGSASDAATQADAGTGAPSTTGGCGCRVGSTGGGQNLGALAVALVTMASVARRRRRR